MAQYEVTMAGFGGQGIMTAGQLLAYAGIHEGKKVVWLPSYGPEMRGGTAYCTVVISDSRIGSPIINNPTCVCAFNRPSLDKFAPRVKPGGLLIVNCSLIDAKSDRTDITQLLVPANDMAIKGGNARGANVVVLGALVAASGIVSFEHIESVLKEKLGSKQEVLQSNLLVLRQGYEFALEQIGQKGRV